MSALINSGGGVGVNGTHPQNGTTALWIASRFGHAAAVKLLLRLGAAVDEARKDGVTPLSIAALNRHSDVVTLLLTEGADVDAADVDGATPLIHAVT